MRSQLRRFAVDVAGEPGAIVLRDPVEGHKPGEEVRPHQGEPVIRDLAALVAAIEEFVDPVATDGQAAERAPDPRWTGRVQAGTISAFVRRLHAADHRLGHLVRAGESRRIDRNRLGSLHLVAEQCSVLARAFLTALRAFLLLAGRRY